jgi:hypothetical protein
MIALRLPLVAVCLAIAAPVLASEGRLQRYTLIVGANSGGADRPLLRYAVSDAERFARVLVELGGVDPANEILLREPKAGDVVEALARLSRRVESGRKAVAASGGRTEVLIYYSGHADEKGLLLGEDRLSYQSLRDRLDEIPADVRIAVLDACASGAFTRIKGGKSRPPFMVNSSASMRGHAFLTSSSATEAAQESDRIRASYFTHYLVSGFRGAADMSGDGQVTLNEAYQFAFTETVGRTVDTKGGAQHPSYDISLTGAGDVVMTDVRQTTATLVLDEDLSGRVYVRSAGKGLVAELFKNAGRTVELGLEPGTYEIRAEVNRMARVAKAEVADGARVVLGSKHFGQAMLESTRRRGEPSDEGAYALAGRSRFEMVAGGWGSNGNIGSSGLDIVGGGHYVKHVRERLAFSFGLQIFGAESVQGMFGGFAAPVSMRWYPLPGNTSQQRVKPFLTVGALPVTSIESQDYTLGATMGVGVDMHVSQAFAVGFKAGFNALPAYDRHDDYKGREFTISLGWLLPR